MLYRHVVYSTQDKVTYYTPHKDRPFIILPTRIGFDYTIYTNRPFIILHTRINFDYTTSKIGFYQAKYQNRPFIILDTRTDHLLYYIQG